MTRVFRLCFLLATMFLQLAFMQTLFAQTTSGQDADKKQAEQYPNIKKLLSQEVDQLLDKHPDTLLLDVREAGDAGRNGSFKGAINIPIGQLEQRLSELPKDRVILAFCNHGGRGSKAADLLEKHGYKVAGAAGVQTYSEAGGSKYLVPPESAKQ